MLDITKIIQFPLPETCYYKEEVKKTSIVIHHTAGSASAKNVIEGWKTRTDKTSTAFVICGKPKATDTFKDGEIYQAFSSKHWGNHLGVQAKHFTPFGLPYKQLNNSSIGIELCNWGWLSKQADGTFKTYVGSAVPKEEVIELPTPYRNYKYYHSYTSNQLISLRDLLIYLCDKYSIDKTFHANMFDVNKEALSGVGGIWSHTSFRPTGEKQDCYPHPQLVNILKTLSSNSI